MPSTTEMLQQAAVAARRAADLLDQGRLGEAAEFQKEADRLMRRARRSEATSSTRSPRRSATPPDRELVVAALAELEVPSSPKLVSAYAAARFGSSLSPTAFASIRRDERRAWKSPRSSRSLYIVPALDASRLTPVRGLVTLSDWDLDRRIVGPRSARVDYLRVTSAVARYTSWLIERDDDGPAINRMLALLGDLASPLSSVSYGEKVDVNAINAGAAAELELLVVEDQRVRSEAAVRAKYQLDDGQQLWGTAPLGVVPKAQGA